MREGLIFEKPDLQTPAQKTTSAVLRVLGLGLWVYVWIPLVTFLGWTLASFFFVDHMLLPDSWSYLISLGWYAVVVAGLAGMVIAWSLYNMLRYGRRRERRPPPPVTPMDMAGFFQVHPDAIVAAQSTKLAVLHLSSEGQVVKLEVAKQQQAVPGILVATTCFELDPIREDLFEAITALGYQPIPSVDVSSGAMADTLTRERCRGIVRNKADILVLLVGGRHDDPLDEGKPIQSLELDLARAKGIPICALVHKELLQTLPLWEAYPDGEFESVVDTPEILSFLAELSQAEEVRVLGFDGIHELRERLRKGMASLFAESLARRRAEPLAMVPLMKSGLTPRALQLVSEMPIAWEAQLFRVMVVQEIQVCQPLRRDLDHEIILGQAIWFPEGAQAVAWMDMQVESLERILRSMERITEVALPEAVGQPGEHGDADHILHLARRFAQGYQDIIEWALSVNRLSAGERGRAMTRVATAAAVRLLDAVERFKEGLETGPLFTITATAAVERPVSLDFRPVLEQVDLSDMREELARWKEEEA